MPAMPLSRRDKSAVLEQAVPPCCALCLLWLGGGLLCMLLFPPLRGSVAGFGWMPLFLLLMPTAVLLVSALLRPRHADSASRRSLLQRAGARHAARSRRRRRLPAQHLAALLAGLGLHRG